MLLYLYASVSSSTMTKIWEPFEIVSSFLQRRTVVFLICDSIELSMRNEWLHHLPSCHQFVHHFYLLAVLFGQISSAVCDFNTKVEPDNWGVKGAGLYRKQQVESYILYFRSVFDLRKLSGFDNSVTCLKKKKINCIFLNCFRIVYILH